MKTFAPVLFVLVLLCGAVAPRVAHAGRCNPNGICTACTNCSGCKNCSQNGGSCSVCRGGRSSSPSSSTSTATRRATKSTSNYRSNYRPSTSAIAAYTRQQQAESRRQAAIRQQNQREIDAWYAAQPFTARCIAVADGDTIQVLQNGKTVRVRLYGIDAPEQAQTFGQQAKTSLSRAAFKRTVKVFPKGKDQYGRTLAWVFVGDKCLNRELVANGLAWHYAQNAPRETKLAALQTAARSQRKGLWSQTATAPWAWRRSH